MERDRIKEQARVGAQVQAHMEKLGTTQTQLGETIGIDRANVTRMLNGRSGFLTRNWAKMLDALGLELQVVEKGKS